ncbi:hypothetical protein L9F63_000010, partial [Diploptera punctata]
GCRNCTSDHSFKHGTLKRARKGQLIPRQRRIIKIHTPSFKNKVDYTPYICIFENVFNMFNNEI